MIPLDIIKRWSASRIWNFAMEDISEGIDRAITDNDFDLLERLMEFREYLWKLSREKSRKGN